MCRTPNSYATPCQPGPQVDRDSDEESALSSAFDHLPPPPAAPIDELAATINRLANFENRGAAWAQHFVEEVIDPDWQQSLLNAMEAHSNQEFNHTDTSSSTLDTAQSEQDSVESPDDDQTDVEEQPEFELKVKIGST